MVRKVQAAGRSFRLIAILSLLWNAMGAVDFSLTAVRYPAYVAQISPDVMDWLDALPVWALIAWGVGTLGALAGSLGLLARTWLAVPAFALSLAGLAGVTYWQLRAGQPEAMQGMGNFLFSCAIWIIALVLFGYSITKTRQGVLA